MDLMGNVNQGLYQTSTNGTQGTTGTNELSASTEDTGTAVSFGEALGLSGLGFGLVFAVLIVLIAFITAMSAALRCGQKKAKPASDTVAQKVDTPTAKAPVAPAPAVQAASDKADMYVTLNGVRHAVSVEEKVPHFTVKMNGKAYGVDVEKAEEE